MAGGGTDVLGAAAMQDNSPTRNPLFCLDTNLLGRGERIVGDAVDDLFFLFRQTRPRQMLGKLPRLAAAQSQAHYHQTGASAQTVAVRF